MNQCTYRQLHGALLDYQGDHAYAEVLLPWLQANTDQHLWLRSINQREGKPIPSVKEDELWDLYALSRVFDLLLLRFQDGGAEADWDGPHISANEFMEFTKAFGLTVVTPTSYSAFYHEVVKVELSDKLSRAPAIKAYRWPCVMLGNLLILRGGVELISGANILSPGVAENSTLYWTYRRKGRPHQDLSHGWGSNSQWRTAFRRDYVIGNVQYFNVDGKQDLHSRGDELTRILESDPELTLEERVELLTNRCFVKCTKPHDELWPYDDRFQIALS